MAGEKQHYLPASVIAGFGERVVGQPRRRSKILVKNLGDGTISISTAEDEAHRRALYRLAAPPPGGDPDIVDSLWTGIENALPELIQRLVNRALVVGDTDLLIGYAAMTGVRHPSFEDVANDHQARQGSPAPAGDQLQWMRVEGLVNHLKVMPDWRWRVLHPAKDADPFMLSDRGWIYIEEIDGGRSIWLPMAPTGGILGYLDREDLPPRRPAFSEHRDVVPSWVTWLNAAAGDDHLFTNSLFTHPNNRQALETLPRLGGLGGLGVNALGPYRGQGFTAKTLYD